MFLLNWFFSTRVQFVHLKTVFVHCKNKPQDWQVTTEFQLTVPQHALEEIFAALKVFLAVLFETQCP